MECVRLGKLHCVYVQWQFPSNTLPRNQGFSQELFRVHEKKARTLGLHFLVGDLGLITAAVAAARPPVVPRPTQEVRAELALDALDTRRGLGQNRLAGSSAQPDGRQLDGGHGTKAGTGGHSGLKGNPGDNAVHLDPAEGLWGDSKVKESKERQLEVVELRERETKQGGIELVRVDTVVRELACDNKRSGKQLVEGPAVDNILVTTLEGLEVAQRQRHALNTIREPARQSGNAPVEETVDARAQEGLGVRRERRAVRYTSQRGERRLLDTLEHTSNRTAKLGARVGIAQQVLRVAPVLVGEGKRSLLACQRLGNLADVCHGRQAVHSGSVSRGGWDSCLRCEVLCRLAALLVRDNVQLWKR